MKKLTYLSIFVLLSISVLAQNFIRNGTYTIASAVNEKVLDVSRAGKNDGANIITYEYNAQANQSFVVNFDNNGVMTIKSQHANKHIAVSNNSSKDLTNIVQLGGAVDVSKQFKIEPVNGTDMYYIIGVHSGKALTVDPSSGNVVLLTKSTADQKSDISYNQFWRFSQRVKYKNRATGKMLDVPHGAATPGLGLIVWENNTNKAQAFDLIPVLNSEKYYIRNLASKKYLGASSADYVSGERIVQNDFNGSELQQFSLKHVIDYTYLIQASNGVAIGTNNNKNTNQIEVVLSPDQSSSAPINWEMLVYDPTSAAQQLKKEVKKTTKETINKVKDGTKKATDKIKKIFR